MLKNYINQIQDIDDLTKSFILRQLKRMPDHYYLAVYVICAFFYILRIQPKRFQLLDKLFTSLTVIKSFEK